MTNAPKPPRVLRLLKCASHGDRVWRGHVMCDACGRVYQTQSEYLARPARDTCLCGVALMPTNPVGDKLGMVSSVSESAIPTSDDLPEQALDGYGEQFSARPICYLCYRIVDKRHGGRVPNWISKEAKTT